MKQSLGRRHRHQDRRLGPAARLAEHQHPRRIAAEGRGVLAHPGQGGDDIHHAHRARLGEPRRLIGQVQIAEGAQAVVDGDHHTIAEARQGLAVEAWRIAGAAIEAAAVDMHQHRPLGARRQSRGPQVEHQTVLAHSAGLDVEHDQAAVVVDAAVGHLRRDLAVVQPVLDAGPGRRRGRRHEAVLAGGVGAVADALEHLHPTGGDAPHLALGGLDHRKDVGGGDRPRRSGGGKAPHADGGGQDRSTMDAHGSPGTAFLNQVRPDYRLKSPLCGIASFGD